MPPWAGRSMPSAASRCGSLLNAAPALETQAREAKSIEGFHEHDRKGSGSLSRPIAPLRARRSHVSGFYAALLMSTTALVASHVGPAWADDYSVATEQQLRDAIADANSKSGRSRGARRHGERAGRWRHHPVARHARQSHPAAADHALSRLRPRGIPVGAIIREVWPFLLVLITILFVLVYVPQLTLWLPELAGYQPLQAKS